MNRLNATMTFCALFLLTGPIKVQASICDHLASFKNTLRVMNTKSSKGKAMLDMCSSSKKKWIKSLGQTACRSSSRQNHLVLKFLGWNSTDVQRFCTKEKSFLYSEWAHQICAHRKAEHSKKSAKTMYKSYYNPSIIRMLIGACTPLSTLISGDILATKGSYIVKIHYSNPYDESKLTYCIQATNSKSVGEQKNCGTFLPGNSIFTFTIKDPTKPILVGFTLKGLRSFSWSGKLPPSQRQYSYTALNQMFGVHRAPTEKSPRYCNGNCHNKALNFCQRLGHQVLAGYRTRDETRAIHSVTCFTR